MKKPLRANKRTHGKNGVPSLPASVLGTTRYYLFTGGTNFEVIDAVPGTMFKTLDDGRVVKVAAEENQHAAEPSDDASRIGALTKRVKDLEGLLRSYSDFIPAAASLLDNEKKTP